MEVAAQVVARPWRTRTCRPRRPSARRRTRTRRRGGWRWPGPGSRRPGTSGRWTATPPMRCGLNTCTGPRPARAATGQGVQVRLGARGDDRTGVAQDDIGEERRLVGPGRGHDQQVLFQRDPQPVPVVGPAEEHRVLARVGDPVPQRQARADPAGAAQRGQAAPAQPQAEDVGEALAGVQPQVQPDPQVPGAVAGQVAGGQERPRERGGQDDQDGQGDGVLERSSRGLRSGRRGRLCAGRCGRRRCSGRPLGPGRR